MYALSLFLACVSALGFWKTLYSEKPLGWCVFYAIFTTLGMLSHYLFVFFLGFQAIYALVWLLRFKQWKRLLYLLPAGLLLAALAVLWLPIYQLQQQGINEDYHFAKGLVDGLRYLTVLVWQPLVVIAGDNRLERLFYMPLAVLLFGYFLYKYVIKQCADRFRSLGFLLMWLLVPMLLQIGYDLLKETHTSVIDRYVLLISPAMAICLGLGLNALASAGKNQWAKGLAGLMILFSIANVWSPSPFRDEHNKKDVRAKLAYMTQNAQPDDLVFVNGPMGAPNLAAWYIVQTRPNQPMLYWISDYRGQRVALPEKTHLAPYKRVWLFRNRANNERGLQQAKDYLKALYPNVTYIEAQDWFLYAR
jgi:4-amino-4-deoxy-L-arabinose transferase-like glycosyltransferase